MNERVHLSQLEREVWACGELAHLKGMHGQKLIYRETIRDDSRNGGWLIIRAEEYFPEDFDNNGNLKGNATPASELIVIQDKEVNRVCIIEEKDFLCEKKN